MKFDTTVVIPTKNRSDMLIRAVRSISQQSLLPNKVIIVDDCSLKPINFSIFSDIDNLDISIINNATSLGGASSRNIGIQNSNTRYVSFLDDDDSWNKNYLEQVKVTLEDLSASDAAVYTSKKFVLSTSLENVFRESVATEVVCIDALLTGNLVGTTSCVTIPRDRLLAVGQFDKSLPALQDYECWLRLAMSSIKFYPVPDAFVYYTINISSKQISGNYFNHIEARDIILKKYYPLLSVIDYKKLNGLLTFFTAKAVHRKNYIASLNYTFRSILLTKKLKVIALLFPYKIFVFMGIYTS
ncbi:glycosyltransferase family 2 protein [Vibrio cyclitrophicus]|uniref:glycosyltransferase family 2 protein n=1 Tax=Vibrio cyclitrophicus TaxID=47951 RepID=UPI0035A5D253